MVLSRDQTFGRIVVRDGQLTRQTATLWCGWEVRRKRKNRITDEFSSIDPPHEPRGWYSVYDKDTTVAIIHKQYNELKLLENTL